MKTKEVLLVTGGALVVATVGAVAIGTGIACAKAVTAGTVAKVFVGIFTGAFALNMSAMVAIPILSSIEMELEKQ